MPRHHNFHPPAQHYPFPCLARLFVNIQHVTPSNFPDNFGRFNHLNCTL